MGYKGGPQAQVSSLQLVSKSFGSSRVGIWDVQTLNFSKSAITVQQD
jgi:hypothetical protein